MFVANVTPAIRVCGAAGIGFGSYQAGLAGLMTGVVPGGGALQGRRW